MAAHILNRLLRLVKGVLSNSTGGGGMILVISGDNNDVVVDRGYIGYEIFIGFGKRRAEIPRTDQDICCRKIQTGQFLLRLTVFQMYVGEEGYGYHFPRENDFLFSFSDAAQTFNKISPCTPCFYL
jgi:hypothetical protein